jgi:hypothetical protein
MKTIKSVKTILKLPGIPAGTEGIFIKANNNHDEQWDFGSGFAFAQGYMELYPDFFEITYEQETFKIGDWWWDQKGSYPVKIVGDGVAIERPNEECIATVIEFHEQFKRKATEAEIKSVTEKEIYITGVKFRAKHGWLKELHGYGYDFTTSDLRKACDIADNLPLR